MQCPSIYQWPCSNTHSPEVEVASLAVPTMLSSSSNSNSTGVSHGLSTLALAAPPNTFSMDCKRLPTKASGKLTSNLLSRSQTWRTAFKDWRITKICICHSNGSWVNLSPSPRVHQSSTYLGPGPASTMNSTIDAVTAPVVLTVLFFLSNRIFCKAFWMCFEEVCFITSVSLYRRSLSWRSESARIAGVRCRMPMRSMTACRNPSKVDICRYRSSMILKRAGSRIAVIINWLKRSSTLK